ncbi:Histidine protein kinase DivJ [Pontiella desulfatans]|uniref:histidine kinase n=1 Tax=Pontiella desulfatans TaxID=2750659 RepID=A0A6C2U150_PONDE|nr:ATP-binding protein [Pontiella desulfatans]VGO13700.1 Histidine protein kinase DivJ [Pontiella desulfatans]
MHATICDLITDLVQNSIEASASEITLNVEETGTNLKVVIADNGKGMSAETLEKAKDPFWSDGLKHKHRKVGLGLPFLFQTSEMTGGTAGIESEEGVGTTVTFNLDPANVDLPMFGNFTTAAVTLMTYGFDGNLTIRRSLGGKEYEVSKHELIEALGDLNDLESLTLLKQFICSQEEELGTL